MLLGEMSGLLSAGKAWFDGRVGGHTRVDDARLVQKIQTEEKQLQSLLQQFLVKPVFRKAVSEVGEAEAERVED
jgi:hypothetical protein